jgi:hypothetical protein
MLWLFALTAAKHARSSARGGTENDYAAIVLLVVAAIILAGGLVFLVALLRRRRQLHKPPPVQVDDPAQIVIAMLTNALPLAFQDYLRKSSGPGALNPADPHRARGTIERIAEIFLMPSQSGDQQKFTAESLATTVALLATQQRELEARLKQLEKAAVTQDRLFQAVTLAIAAVIGTLGGIAGIAVALHEIVK